MKRRWDVFLYEISTQKKRTSACPEWRSSTTTYFLSPISLYVQPNCFKISTIFNWVIERNWYCSFRAVCKRVIPCCYRLICEKMFCITLKLWQGITELELWGKNIKEIQVCMLQYICSFNTIIHLILSCCCYLQQSGTYIGCGTNTSASLQVIWILQVTKWLNFRCFVKLYGLQCVKGIMWVHVKRKVAEREIVNRD